MGGKKKNKKTNKILGIVVAIIAIVSALYLGKDYVSYDEYIANVETNAKQATEKFAENFKPKEETSIPKADGKLKVYFIDVGQADCILLVNNKSSMLIDAGNNEDGELVVNYIKSLGISKLDYVVGTHPHEDHIGGLDNVINSFEIGEIFMPETTTNTKTYEDVLNAIANKNLQITVPKIGDKFNIGTAEAEVLSVKNDNVKLNNCSIVIRVVFGEKSFLFTGDAEEVVESKLKVKETTVLKVGHHGSSTSTSQTLLNKIKPKYAIISVGKNNDYGHPTKQTLKRLQDAGCEIHRTDEEGTILITTDGKDLKIDHFETKTNGN